MREAPGTGWCQGFGRNVPISAVGLRPIVGPLMGRRRGSFVAAPASDSFRIPMICASVNRVFLMIPRLV